jgi:hypothetical protein
MDESSTSCSRANLRVAGVARTSVFDVRVCDGEGDEVVFEAEEEDVSGGETGAGEGSGVASDAAGAVSAITSPPSTSMLHNTLPTLSMSPAAPAKLAILPENGDVISTDALSDLRTGRQLDEHKESRELYAHDLDDGIKFLNHVALLDEPARRESFVSSSSGLSLELVSWHPSFRLCHQSVVKCLLLMLERVWQRVICERLTSFGRPSASRRTNVRVLHTTHAPAGPRSHREKRRARTT